MNNIPSFSHNHTFNPSMTTSIPGQDMINHTVGFQGVQSNGISKTLAKTILLISSIYLIMRTVTGILRIAEFIGAAESLNCDYFDLFRLSKKQFEKINQFAEKKHGINLRQSCTEGFLGNIYISNTNKTFSKIVLLMDAEKRKNDPLHGKKCSDIEFVDFRNNLFKDIKKDGFCIEGMYTGVLVNKTELANRLVKLAEEKFGDGADAVRIKLIDFISFASELSDDECANIFTFGKVNPQEVKSDIYLFAKKGIVNELMNVPREKFYKSPQ